MTSVVATATVAIGSQRFGGQGSPELRGRERDKDNQSEKRLGQTGMKDSDFIFQHGDAQATEHALQNHRGEGAESESTQPPSAFNAVQPRRENDR